MEEESRRISAGGSCSNRNSRIVIIVSEYLPGMPLFLHATVNQKYQAARLLANYLSMNALAPYV